MAAPSYEAAVTDANLNGASVTTGTDGAFVDMSSHFGVHGTIEGNFPGSPTDDLIVEAYGAIDGGTDYADTPFWSQTIVTGKLMHHLDLHL